MKKIFFMTAVLAAMLFVDGAFLNAQVTVGGDKTPEVFSILELISNAQNGLRLPQIATIAEREAISDAHGGEPEMMGLTIFNMETHCVETWNGTVWIAECGTMPMIIPSTPSDPLPAGRLTAYINAMYDFQKQTLTAFLTSGTASAYQWEMSTDNGATWYDIVGATAQNYIIPADFMYDYAGVDKSASTPASINVLFRCLITTSTVTGYTPPVYQLDMLFVRTTTAGYGEQGGVRYLTINFRTPNINLVSGLQRGMGDGGDKPSDPGGESSNGTIKMALLNLGQSDDGSNADDLGDYYQWGRKADGHEKVTWSKNASYVNMITPLNDPPVAGPLTANLDANGQIITGNTGYGVFITNSAGAWGNMDLDLWGSGAGEGRANEPADISGWSTKGKANNPCPSGWYIPSSFDFWDMYNGDGSNLKVVTTGNDGINNTWTFRAGTSANNVYGCELVTNNSTGEILILPAVATRNGSSGSLSTPSTGSGYYWSSNSGNSTTQAHLMDFWDNYLSSSSYTYRATGESVRCIAR